MKIVFESYKNCQNIKLQKDCVEVVSKILFSETVMDKTFEKNFRFYVKWPTTRKFQYIVFSDFGW